MPTPFNPKGGVPNGKAILWVNVDTTNVSGYLLYDSMQEAMVDIMSKLKEHEGSDAVINYKTKDGETLFVAKLRFHHKKKAGVKLRDFWSSLRNSFGW